MFESINSDDANIPPELWQDSNGDSPDLTAEWSWDIRALRTGQYVGFKLYCELRHRMYSLNLPAQDHDRLIMYMIEIHDEQLLTTGVGCATLVNPLIEQINTGYTKVKILEGDIIKPMVPTRNLFESGDIDLLGYE